MLRPSLIITFLIVLAGCKNNEDIILSRYRNGQAQEVLTLDHPITNDSTGMKKVFYSSGKLQCSGPVSRGRRNGLWTCYDHNDSIKWKATYKMDIEDGETFCRGEDGSWKTLTLRNGVKDGKTTLYYYSAFNKQHYYVHGQYSFNLEQGLWTKTDTNGVILIEMTLINGERIGYFTNRYPNGQIRLKGELQKDGSMRNFTFYDENGKQTTKESYALEKI